MNLFYLMLKNFWFAWRRTGFFISISFCFFLFSFVFVFVSFYFFIFPFSFLWMFLLLIVFFFSLLFFYCFRCYRQCNGYLRGRFLLSGVFYLRLLPEIWHNLLLSRLSCGRSSALKVTGLPTEVRNTDPSHLFVWITQCSAII